MSQRFKSLIAIWFTLQIALPFTAPLQTCDLRDLLGTTPHGTPDSQESSTTPPAPEARSFVSPLAPSALRASISLAVVQQVAVTAPFVSTFGLSPSPHGQQTILRL